MQLPQLSPWTWNCSPATDLRTGDPETSLNIDSIKCRICGESLSTSKIEQELHELMHVKDILKVCSICNKSFFDVDEFGVHMDEHFEEADEKYRCEACGASFSFKHHLRRHACPAADVKPVSSASSAATDIKTASSAPSAAVDVKPTSSDSPAPADVQPASSPSSTAVDVKPSVDKK